MGRKRGKEERPGVRGCSVASGCRPRPGARPTSPRGAQRAQAPSPPVPAPDYILKQRFRGDREPGWSRGSSIGSPFHRSRLPRREAGKRCRSCRAPLVHFPDPTELCALCAGQGPVLKVREFRSAWALHPRRPRDLFSLWLRAGEGAGQRPTCDTR